MNKKQHTLTVALALVAGLIGGVISSQLLAEKPVHTEKPTKAEKVVMAEAFQLVDRNGKVLASLNNRKRYKDEPSPELRLLTPQYGHEGGVLITAKPYGADVNVYGKDRHISLSASWIDEFEIAEVKIGSSPNLLREIREVKLSEMPEGQQKIPIPPAKQFDRSSIEMTIGPGEDTRPRVVLTDKEGKKRTVLGCIDLETTATGETQQRPPSSLVFFDKEGNVFWSAP
jgi:hypothetical protein